MYDLDYNEEFNDDGNEDSENTEENESGDQNIYDFDDFETDLRESTDDANLLNFRYPIIIANQTTIESNDPEFNEVK